MTRANSLSGDRHWAIAAGIACMVHAAVIATALATISTQHRRTLPDPVMVLELAPVGRQSEAAPAAVQHEMERPDQAERNPAPADSTQPQVPETPTPLPSIPAPLPVAPQPAPTRTTPMTMASAPQASVQATQPNPQERAGHDPKAKAAEVNYFALVSAHLNRRKTYPAEARKAMQQGVVTVRFTVQRDGSVSGVSIKRSSGHTLLDQATLDLMQRVAPLPKFPKSMARDIVTLSLPIEYSLRTS